MSTATRPRRASRTVFALSAATLLAFAAACSSDNSNQQDTSQDMRSAFSFRDAEEGDGSGGATETVTETETATGSPTATATLDPDPAPTEDFSTSPQENWDYMSGLSVTDVRVGSNDGFDRVVFELDGPDVGWFVRYEDPPTQMGSGYPIEHPGDSALMVDVLGIAYPFDTEQTVDLTNRSVNPTGTGSILRVSGHGIFEGHAQFLISVDGEQRPFRVFALEGPNRLVVDVQTSS
ncbi:AMIN-like domain-containing (lipo)protein [Corynebacterium sputi]|uniref:AMIN-like domain-containing (lipo)protein n=1 Tax=Corynebacterium sputi TaxID=489915 RepID=UPI00040BC1AA|nr:hypothetical protein [Corynebacterium sputi]